MSLGKQAKVLSPAQEKAILSHLGNARWAARDKVIFLLSTKAGLRAKEIAGLRWRMITDGEGNLNDHIALEDEASKGKSGRIIPMHPQLRIALEALEMRNGAVVRSERGGGMSAKSVGKVFERLYAALGMEGCSSHSGRRTFITRAARKVSEVGASVRDVQRLAGHSSMQTTQRYIEEDPEAQRKLVDLV